MAWPAAAEAQSFLQTILGLGEDSARPVQAPRVSVRPDSVPREREFVPQSKSDAAASAQPSNEVQTMCVRTCDGYYWPLHFPVARTEISRDVALCRSTCDSETRLYTRADPGVEPEEMLDADGNSYGASATAFRYRKGLLNGCTCRPMPWSEGERARHEGYALAEQEKKLRAELAEAERLAAASRPDESNQSVPVASVAAGPVPAEAEDGPPMGPLEKSLLASRESAASTVVEMQGEHVAANLQQAEGYSKPVRAGREPRSSSRNGRADVRPERGGKRTRLAQQSGSSSGAFGWLAGPAKFTYPGDPPSR